MLVNQVVEELRAALAAETAKRQELEALLVRAERLVFLGNLAANIGHELNNLSAIYVGVRYFVRQRMAAGQLPEEEDLDRLDRVAEHLAAHARQLLTLGQPDESPRQVYDLRDISADTIALLHRSGRTKYVEVRQEYPEVPVLVEACRVHLEQILCNLLVNAADAMVVKGRATMVTVRLGVIRNPVDSNRHESGETDASRAPEARAAQEYSRYFEQRSAEAARRSEGIAARSRSESSGFRINNGWVECVVADTGSGMDAHTMAHAFEPFFTTKPSGIGTGLGLFIVRELVRQYDGTVKIASRVGEGTQVLVRLPQATGDRTLR